MMADEEQGKEEQGKETSQSLPDTFTRAQVDQVLAEAREQGKEEGRREVQSAKDREVAQKDKAISELTVLSGINNLSDEERAGLVNMAEVQRSTANAWGKAHSLSQSEVRLLATLPVSVQETEAEKMIVERPQQNGQQSNEELLQKATASKSGASPLGSADASLNSVGGGERPAPAGFRSVDEAMNAMLRAQERGDEAEVRRIAAATGMNQG
jgi:hypothetical protein